MSLRRWQLASARSLTLAADARLSQTDYADDQIWELLLGSGESPALQLQTRYGGRAGLVSLVPMWAQDGRSIYQAQAYIKPPVLTGFAPGYLRVEAALTPQLHLQAEYWAMESHAVGAQFTVTNTGKTEATLGLDLIGFVGINGKEQKTLLLPLPDGSPTLSLGNVGNLQPIVLLDGGTAETAQFSGSTSPRLRRKLSIPAGGTTTARFVHAGLSHADDALALAQRWLQADWGAAFAQIESASEAVPNFETGDADLDAVLAFSYQQLVSGFLKPTASLPNSSFIATRDKSHGYQTEHDRGWNGQTPTLAYTTALAIASIQPEMAQGIIRNYLAIQQTDGWIDWKPGLGGQKQGILVLPILARLSWGIFQYTEDNDFLNAVFPGLLKGFQRWLQPDLDKDSDGLPEWQSENQTGYVYTPTFAAWQAWAQGADIRLVEAPDLLAYLLSEARSLKEIAYYLRQTEAEIQLEAYIQTLKAALEKLWNDDLDRYTYRDRDSHLTTTSESIIHDARGMDEMLPAQTLTEPNRLIVRVQGGLNLVPRMMLKLQGLDAHGGSLTETATGEQFVWATGRGVYTSQHVFSQLDQVSFEGLSRVYRVDVQTVDTTRLDIHTLLPLWAGGLSPEHTAALFDILIDDRFWRANGVTMNASDDPNFDPSNAEGSGGVWPYWLTLIGEALIELGKMDQAVDLLKRLLKAQTTVFQSHGHFTEFYNSDTAQGLGEENHLAGIAPLYLLMRVIGVRIISAHKVWVGGQFAWGKAITLQQHGVKVRRDAQGTHIEFPSGKSVDVSGVEWQEINDDHA